MDMQRAGQAQADVSAPAVRSGLFRTEVLEGRSSRLYGDIWIVPPVRWQLLGFFLLGVLLVAIGFLAMARVARVETVPGAIALDRGIAPIMPSRQGVVVQVRVREGQVVPAGAPLVEIRAEESMAKGRPALARVLDAMEEQEAGLMEQAERRLAAAAADESRLLRAIDGFTEELTQLDAQLRVQRQLVQTSEGELARTREIAAKGFISRRDVVAREEAVLARTQQYSQLLQSRIAKVAAITDARASIARLQAEAGAELAGKQSSRAELQQRRASAEGEQGYLVTAPVAGTVTALTARPGQAVAASQPLLILVPSGGRTRAELYVPTSAAGFLRVGQDVRLMVDAFPFEQYGAIDATLTHISRAAIPRETSDGKPLPVFLVTAELKEGRGVAAGAGTRLLPGMTLSARIATRRMSLVEWVFRPFTAVRRR